MNFKTNYELIIKCLIHKMRIALDSDFIPKAMLERAIEMLKYTPKDVKYAISNVTLDLLHRQDLDINHYEQYVSIIGVGGSSVVFQIGEFVLKLGVERFNDKIPNHERILQPLIRCVFSLPSIGNISSLYLEVQNLVDRDWYKNMSFQERMDVIDKISTELTDSGINWEDNKSANIGKLLKPNKPNITIGYTYNNGSWVPDEYISSDSLGLVGDSFKVLPAGEYVILDTDSLVPLNFTSIDEYAKNLNDGESR